MRNIYGSAFYYFLCKDCFTNLIFPNPTLDPAQLSVPDDSKTPDKIKLRYRIGPIGGFQFPGVIKKTPGINDWELYG
jgi:hypothetical protein